MAAPVNCAGLPPPVTVPLPVTVAVAIGRLTVPVMARHLIVSIFFVPILRNILTNTSGGSESSGGHGGNNGECKTHLDWGCVVMRWLLLIWKDEVDQLLDLT